MRHAAWSLIVAGCNITGPAAEYVNRRPLEPVPDWYREAYRQTEECLGVRGNFGAVRWFVAERVVVGGTEKAGALRFPHDITMWERAAHHEWAVRHEASHHILQRGDDLHDEHGQVPCSIGADELAVGELERS